MSIPPSRLIVATAALSCAPLFVHAGDAHDDWYDAFTPKIAYTGEAGYLLDGGEHPHHGAFAGQLLVGTDVDMNQLFGWQGATLEVDATQRHGTNLSRGSIGNSTPVQEVYGGQGARLANFTLRQKLLDDRLIIEGGRSPANIHFLNSQLCAYFQGNSACGNPTFVSRTSNFSGWPVSSWALDTRFWITPHVYVHAATFEVNPVQAEHGQHGLNWSTRDDTGWITPYAIGYQTDAEASQKAAMYELGGWQDNSKYQDPLNDAEGQPAVTSGAPYATRRDRAGVYARFEQQVTQPDGQSGRGLTVFGTAMKGTEGRLIESWFLEAGLVQKGTFANRPDDDIAFVVTEQKYTSTALENLRLARAAAGGVDTLPNSQIMMELSYGIQLLPKLRVAPGVQYIIHPDQFNDPGRTHNLPNAMVASLRFDWTLL